MSEPLSSIDKVRNKIAMFLVGSFVGMLVMLLFVSLPESNKDIVTYMVGQLSGMTTTALGLYFAVKIGQEALDSKRDENTGKLADAVVAAANAVPQSTVGAADGAQKAADSAQGVADDLKGKDA